MRIYLVRHGETNLNKDNLMQGRVNEPLNDHGREQAKAMADKLKGIHFDRIFVSPLDRAQETAEIISGLKREEMTVEPRIIETDFGKYEKADYYKMGVPMTLYWALPEVFPAPKTVESVKSMVKRSHGFLKELEDADYDNVLIVCHGGIIRALRGYLEHSFKGIRWRPKPKNCEVSVYESLGKGRYKHIETM